MLFSLLELVLKKPRKSGKKTIDEDWKDKRQVLENKVESFDAGFRMGTKMKLLNSRPNLDKYFFVC